MKYLNKYSVISMALVFALPVLAVSSEFDDFKRQQNAEVAEMGSEYEKYREAYLREFEDYKKAYDEALNQYRGRIKSSWGEFRDEGPQSWVSYASNDKIRRTVDFEKGVIELEQRVPKGGERTQVAHALKNHLSKLLAETEASVFRNDEVAQKVEKLLEQKKDVVRGKPSERSVLQGLIPELKSPKAVAEVSRSLEEKASTDVRASAVKDQQIVRVKFTLPDTAHKKAVIYRDIVKKISQKEEIPSSIIFSIMEAESNFNPLARSHIPAYGLMQIVPRSAGMDATQYLYGKPRLLSPSFLYDGDNNVKIGGAYIHILFHRYLGKVENPVSRLYCAIAAYNTGAGNVAKAFGSGTNINKAVRKINRMSPREVYRNLIKNLPYEETRKYLRKVSLKLSKYQA